MSNDSIQTLQPQSLSSLRFLERLDLSFNRLCWLTQGFSQSLPSLQELWLDHNLLQHLDSTSLGDFENLRKLDLSYIRIRAMDVKAFSSLEANRLNVLKDGLLSRQQRLEVLLLSHNNISLIESDSAGSQGKLAGAHQVQDLPEAPDHHPPPSTIYLQPLDL
ncbi:podocan-like protein 1 [Sander vitreus]